MRIGILGGTFNPVHVGHLRLALEAAEALRLDRVHLTPCSVPPHKPGDNLLPFALRVLLLRAAVEGTPRLYVDTVEAALPAPSYTWNLLAAWRDKGGETPCFLLGDEDFAMLPSWHRGAELPGLADFAVVPRSGMDAAVFQQALERLNPAATTRPVPGSPGLLEASPVRGRRCFFLPVPRLDISASKVRALWCAGAELRYLVPDAALAVMSAQRGILERCWNANALSAPCGSNP